MSEELKVIISAEVAKFKQGVDDAKKKIGQFKEQVAKAAKDVDKNFKAIGASVANAAKKVGVGIAAIGAALIGNVAATEEYRNEQTKLITAFEAAGSSAATAKETYNDLYRVLGDSGQAVEAANHLAKLTKNEQDLSTWTNICQGVYATFGDSLPIEGLTEAANETAKTGSLTGVLADALNWAGVSEDTFQASLDACNTEAEREQLIRETLNGLYADAALKYEENNAKILAQRDAQAALQEKLAALGDAIAPVLTLFTSLANDALAFITPMIQQLAETYLPQLESILRTVGDALAATFQWAAQHKEILAVMAGIIMGVVAAIGLYNAVAAVKAAMTAAEVASVWGLVSAYAAQAAAMIAALAPYLLIVAAIGLLVGAFLYLWNNCEGFRQFWIDLWEKVKTAFSQFVESLKPLIDAVVNAFKQAWELIKVIWDKVKPYFEMIWNNIKVIFSVVKDVLGGFFSAAWEAIKAVWDVVVSFFTTIWNNVAAVFSVVKSVLTGDFQGAWDGIKQIFSNFGEFFSTLWESVKKIFSAVGEFFSGAFSSAWEGIKNIFSNITGFFSGIWENIKNIFANVGKAIGDAVRGAVSNAVNKVLSTACKIINGFIKAINFAIGIINAIPGVNISKIKELSVPAMAKGGVVDGATLAMIGEQGKEAVVPLENNLEWLDKLAGMLNERMGGGGKQPIVLQVDGKTFAQTSIDSINQLTKQTGSLGLVLG